MSQAERNVLEEKGDAVLCPLFTPPWPVKSERRARHLFILYLPCEFLCIIDDNTEHTTIHPATAQAVNSIQ